MFTLRLRAAVLALGVMSGWFPLPSSAVASSAGVVGFNVVLPDGSPVRRPIVMTSVFGRTYAAPRVSTGTLSGRVAVEVPLDDAVVRERIAAGEPVNLLIRVFDKKPGERDINAAYVGAAFTRGPDGAIVEISSVNGVTITLRPGRTAFKTVTGAGLNGAADAASALMRDDEPDCPHYGPGTPVPCHVEDRPEWSRSTLIPIAENHGAGADVTSSLVYRSTHVTKSNFAVEVGGTGFMESDGSVGFEQENQTSLGYASVGNGVNKKSYLVVTMLRTRSGACYQDFPSTEWNCQLETTYRPSHAHGTKTVDWPGDHEHLDRQFDCWTYIDGHLSRAKGETERLLYSLRLGPSESWAVGSERVLYANTTVTGQTNTTKGHIRRWDVTGNAYRYHYLYVPNGLASYDRFQWGGGPGACVETAAPQIRTQSSDSDYGHIPTEPVQPVAEVPEEPDPEAPGRTVCGRMPDKCD